MRVQCHFFGPLREEVGAKTVEREVEPGTTVRELLEDLGEEYPGLRDPLFDEGDLDDSMAITRNSVHLSSEDGAETELEDGDDIRASTPITGG